MLTALILIFINCNHKNYFQNFDSKNTTDIQHILTDTLNTYLKNNYWYAADENGLITCRPCIYICFQHIGQKKFVSFAMSPHIMVDTSFEVTYYKSINDEFLFCILLDAKDSINTTFVNKYPLESLDFCYNSHLSNPCFYDGRIFLRSYEIAHKQDVGDTLLLLAKPLTIWICNPPEAFF